MFIFRFLINHVFINLSVECVFRASRGLIFQNIFLFLRANHGDPSGDGELSAKRTNKFLYKLATMGEVLYQLKANGAGTAVAFKTVNQL